MAWLTRKIFFKNFKYFFSNSLLKKEENNTEECFAAQILPEKKVSNRKDAFFLVPFAGSAADAPVLLGRGVVRVPRTSLWPGHGAIRFHDAHLSGGGVSQGLWHPADHYPRRHACRRDGG